MLIQSQPSAADFKTERHDNLNFSLPTNPRIEVTPDELVKDVVNNLLQEDALAEYMSAMQLSDIHVNKTMVRMINILRD